MNYTYKQLKFNGELITDVIFRIEDMASIPFDQANTDYQAYLKWVSEGNTPESADE
jgi:hypothetical protein